MQPHGQCEPAFRQDFDLWTVTVPYLTAGELKNFYFDSAQIPVPNRMNYENPMVDDLIRQGSPLAKHLMASLDAPAAQAPYTCYSGV
jgi:hypothetical protein